MAPGGSRGMELGGTGDIAVAPVRSQAEEARQGDRHGVHAARLAMTSPASVSPLRRYRRTL
jgi:hypothetical protein